jgi:acetyltransferase-like isoleucine patch superfamily enzyme
MSNLLKKILRFLISFSKISSNELIRKLRKKGFQIGERTFFYDPESNTFDFQTPFLLKIGNDVQITKGVCFLNHGYDWSVIKGLNGEILGSRGAINIGNNVFIGINTVFLKNSSVGDNVIIGAGSVVTASFGSNVVIAGNPAKVIMTLDQYLEKRKFRQVKEATEIFLSYYKKYRKIPSINLFWEYFWIFSIRNDKNIKLFSKQFLLVGTKEMSIKKFYVSTPIFPGFDAFVAHCLKLANE